MKRIIPVIEPGGQGDEVGNLQDALIALLRQNQILATDPQTNRRLTLLVQRERSQSQYSDGTQRTVGVFQEEHHLQNNGIVDEPTAKALNELLRQLGLLEEEPAPPPAPTRQVECVRIVAGRVLRQDGGALPGALVRAFDGDTDGRIRLGEDTTDREGLYTIRYQPLPEVDHINLRVVVFDAAGSRLAEAFLESAGPVASVDLTVDADSQTFWQVTGRAVSPTSAGTGGLRVEIVDKGVGGDLHLADASTAADGTYRASFTTAAFRDRNKDRPDLQARLYRGETLLAESEVRYDASERETLNIALTGDTAKALSSEHETLTAALGVLYRGNLRDLEEKDGRRDISFLANKSGWDARAVAMAALADRFSQDSGAAIGPDFYYALFRAGLPANDETLYRADPGTVQRALEQAAERGVLTASRAAEIPQVVDQFRELSAGKLLTAAAPVGVSSLGQMLAVSGLDEEQQKTFASLYAKHRDDLSTFWQEAAQQFGEPATTRLQVDGKLSFLTLNNAPLVKALHDNIGEQELGDPLALAQEGFHRPEKWDGVLSDNIAIPAEIPGEKPEEKRARYKEYLAASVRLSYPTASIAQMIGSGDLPLAAAGGVTEEVQSFLTQHQAKFELGVEPVQRYLASNNVQLGDAAVGQIKRVQRAYQLTTSDRAMAALMRNDLDSAMHITSFDRASFVSKYGEELGGEGEAAETYDRALRVHGAVLNVALSYITARNGVPIGARPAAGGQGTDERGGAIIDPGRAPQRAGGPGDAPMDGPSPDLLVSPTLEGLFGEMDFCSCEHCRSILSPAAYLVDLLLFIDRPDAGLKNPQAVLLKRRPDIEHLPLTCENTNTALPYIDVVNEALEYFVVNSTTAPARLSLEGYEGHDTAGAASEDLLVSPQNVSDAAYNRLRDEHFPPPLPFHQPLESLRGYFAKFEVGLPEAMEALRDHDDMERGAHTYGWRDIWMEELHLSREEHELLTNTPNAVPLWDLYGFPSGTSDADVIAGVPNFTGLANAKYYSRRMGISYEDLVAILRTRFVNPSSDLIPQLERLGVPFAAFKALKDGDITDAAFDALLPTGAATPDPAEYHGDIKAWIRDNDNYARIMSIITLVDPTLLPEGAAETECSFESLELRYSEPLAAPGDASTRLGAVEYVRLARFIRLWKKLGWTIDATDAAICALYPPPASGETFAEAVDTIAKLDAGFLALLPRLGALVRTMRLLKLTVARDLPSLLVLWSDIGTHGTNSLYRQMFLNPALLAQDAVFADDGYGHFLETAGPLANHAEAVRSALGLTGDEYARIVTHLGLAAANLTLPNVSAIFRYGYLARKLRLSVRELLLLTELTGLEPFVPPAGPQPDILKLLDLVQSMKAAGLRTPAALYLVWNQDLSGRSAPDPAQVANFARTLRAELNAIETELAVQEDPDGAIAQARLALVYGPDAAAFFFGLLNETFSTQVTFDDANGIMASGSPTLAAIQAAAGTTRGGAPRIGYDDFRKSLAFTGLLSTTIRDAIKAAAGAGADANPFKAAVDDLYDEQQAVLGPFFARYPELQAPAEAFAGDFSALLRAILPELVERRKAQQALQGLASAAATDLALTQAVVVPALAPGEIFPLHAAGHNDRPALDDLLAIQSGGLTAAFYDGSAVAGDPASPLALAANLDYKPLVAGVGNPLPANTTSPGDPISGVWSGLLEAPENGFYILRIEADADANVALELDGKAVTMTNAGTEWRNADAVELRAGAPVPVELTVTNVRDVVRVQWEWTPRGQGRNVIPAGALYPSEAYAAFRAAYLRFLKAAALADDLGLTGDELAFLATHTDYRLSPNGQFLSTGQGWLNSLPNEPNLGLADAAAAALAAALNKSLGEVLAGLLDYARIKSALKPAGDELLDAVRDPVAATATPEAGLFAVTRWDAVSLDALLARFGKARADLGHVEALARVHDGFALCREMGIGADALIDASTNDPTGPIVRGLQAALRARYDPGSWRDLVRPVNDELRSRQRDSLVASILQKMSSDPDLARINTPDRLFEYFLMDVQMDPCMQTSRIRHALSSVQLFIERCLMHLEQNVDASTLNAAQWEWMKRYRVWEANRKVYLYAENWLEPELRDDKSPIFKEIESELQQSDITEDKAAMVLLNYLGKLGEIAKLEPCGIHHIPANPGLRTPEINHVIARSAGANRTYYYRRQQGVSWLPWEQIKLEIEDNPVLPYVWKDRLLLFWVKVIKQTSSDPSALQGSAGPKTGDREKNLNELSLSEVKSNAKGDATKNAQVKIGGVLCWSECVKGKWLPVRTSDVNAPADLGVRNASGSGAFVRTNLSLSAKEYSDGLRITISHPPASKSASYVLYNTHSLPELDNPSWIVFEIWPRSRSLDEDSVAGEFFALEYNSGGIIWSTVVRNILKRKGGDAFVQPQHELADIWSAPFFYFDPRHVFFVESVTSIVPIWQPPDYGIFVAPSLGKEKYFPPIVQKFDPRQFEKPPRWQPPTPGPDPRVFDPAPIKTFVTEDAYLKVGLGTNEVVMYGDQPIGPSGGLAGVGFMR